LQKGAGVFRRTYQQYQVKVAYIYAQLKCRSGKTQSGFSDCEVVFNSVAHACVEACVMDKYTVAKGGALPACARPFFAFSAAVAKGQDFANATPLKVCKQAKQR